METICGADCDTCHMKSECNGCIYTGGKPFGGECIVAKCCKTKKLKKCSECNICDNKKSLIEEINNLNIDGLHIDELYQLCGEYINLEYNLNNNKIKFWNNTNIYYGAQVEKDDKCYGIAADDEYILISTYEENGKNPEIILFKKR